MTEKSCSPFLTHEMHSSVVCLFFWCVFGLCFYTFSLKMPPDLEIWWWLVWWSRGSEVLRNNWTSKELTQHLHCWICCMHCYPILLKLVVFKKMLLEVASSIQVKWLFRVNCITKPNLIAGLTWYLHMLYIILAYIVFFFSKAWKYCILWITWSDLNTLKT